MACLEPKVPLLFFPTIRLTQEIKKITTYKLHTRTKFQRFLSKAPSSSFKKFIVSTPPLLQGLHTMILAKPYQTDYVHENASKQNYVSHHLSPTCPLRMRSKKKSKNEKPPNQDFA